MAQSRAALKRAHEKRERKTKQRRLKIMRNISFLILGVAAVSVGIFFLVGRGDGGPGVAVPDMGNFHILTVDSPHLSYNSDPPTSGPTYLP